ncbi:MAG: SHD1 domain-containing protein [Verrucomicrobiota bacterium]
MKYGDAFTGIGLIAVCLLNLASARAEVLLRVDFDLQASAVEEGFSTYLRTEKNKTFPNGITVAVKNEQAWYDSRGPVDTDTFTYGDLYRDFIFNNTGIPIAFDISGLTPNTRYEITWYGHQKGYDFTSRIQPREGSNTSGSTVDLISLGAAPLSNEHYSATGVWMSTDDSLEIDVAFVSDNFGRGELIRVNGFELKLKAYPLEGKIKKVRVWTSRSGTRTRAQLLAVKDNKVFLYTEQRSRVAIEIDKLSEQDRTYLVTPISPRTAGQDWSMVKPVSIAEDSGSYSRKATAARLIDATGLSEDLTTGTPIPESFPVYNGTYKEMWLSRSGAPEQHFVVFDLGELYTLNAIYIWPFAMPGRTEVSVKQLNIYVSSASESKGLTDNRRNWQRIGSSKSDDTFTLEAITEGGRPEVQRLSFHQPVKARLLMMDFLTNHSGKDKFVGLSKVRFSGRAGP